MGRPFSNIAQISTGFEMYARGYRRASILKAFPDKSRPSVRTLGNWITKYREVPGDNLRLEQQFEWRDMDMFSISWEYADLIARLIPFEAYSPSVRRVRWWLRVKQMYPHYLDSVITMLSNKFVVNDHMDLLRIPGSDWSILSDASHSDGDTQLELLAGTFAACFFELDTNLPSWVQNGVFLSIVRTEHRILVVCSDEMIPETEKFSRGWYCLKHEGEGISWNLVLSKTVPSDDIQIFSVLNTNYLLTKNLGMIKSLGINIIEPDGTNN